MKSTEFCYWLQGYLELTPRRQPLTAKQVQVIQNHLNLVFKHEIDPSYGLDPVTAKATHDGIQQKDPATLLLRC